MRRDMLFVVVLTLLLTALVVVCTLLPRSRYSELERRDLAHFPSFTWQGLCSGDFTTEVGHWFNDSQPLREPWMKLSMQIRHGERWSNPWSQKQIVFIAGEGENEDETQRYEEEPDDNAEYHNRLTADDRAKMSKSGILVIGEVPHVRALMTFKAEPRQSERFARVVNLYRRRFPLRVYCMPIPTAVEFYCPDQARSLTKSEKPVIDHLFASLSDSVEAVSIYETLGRHADEPIFLRTDHHWAPLGAYYAAREFAHVAGVKVPDLNDFVPHEVPDYVGTMYGYAQDPSIRLSPESFLYHTPKHDFQSYVRRFVLDADLQITSEQPERQGDFFITSRATSESAYCTFMGGDALIMRIENPSVQNGRHLLLLKDSFGNALPPYLFASFNQVHIIDFRYFPYRIADYIAEHHITDILFAHNISHACTRSVAQAYESFLDLSLSQ